MTITVVGHLSVDEIHIQQKTKDNGTPNENFGGIFYSLVTLASLMGQNDIIHPVFGVGEKEYDSFKKKLDEYPTIDQTGIFEIKGSTNRVQVYYEKDKTGRIECSKDISEPIPFNKIKPYLDADGIFINMVSGSDITLETHDRIRMSVRDARTPIHFDFHSLTLGIDPDHKRFRRPLMDWRRWCFMLNSIQMSEEEASGLTAERFDEPTLINHLMPLMVNAFVITRGERGVTAVLQKNKKLTHHDFSGSTFGPAIDPMGCGDVFGAAFLYHYLREKDYSRAADFANQVAGMKSTVKGPDGLATLAERLKSGSFAH